MSLYWLWFPEGEQDIFSIRLQLIQIVFWQTLKVIISRILDFLSNTEYGSEYSSLPLPLLPPSPSFLPLSTHALSFQPKWFSEMTVQLQVSDCLRKHFISTIAYSLLICGNSWAPLFYIFFMFKYQAFLWTGTYKKDELDVYSALPPVNQT